MQALVRRAIEAQTPGTQLYDSDVAGLRLVVGKTSCSFKHVGRVNDGTGRYVSIIVGRSDEMSLITARSRSVELRQALARGEDPRARCQRLKMCCAGMKRPGKMIFSPQRWKAIASTMVLSTKLKKMDVGIDISDRPPAAKERGWKLPPRQVLADKLLQKLRINIDIG